MAVSALTADSAVRDRARTFTIGELAAELGVTPRAIRFYEDRGLLAPRRAGQARIYSHRDRARLMLIRRGRRLGFSVAELKEFLDLYEVDRTQKGQAAYALVRVRARIEALERQRQDLEQTLAELRELEAGLVRHLGAAPGVG